MAFFRLVLQPVAKLRSPSSYFSGAALLCRHLSNEPFPTSSASLSALVKPITVRTCVGLYPQLVRSNPGLYAAAAGNTEGIDLTVEYLDTATLHSKDSSSSSKSSAFCQKTILAIPGTGGHYGNYSALVHHFANRPEVRILAPNLPDFSHTRKGGRLFWHSNAELVAFLRDFLTTLDVQTVDVALCHSMGIHRLLGLFATAVEQSNKSNQQQQPLTIRSAAFFGAQPLYDLQAKHVAFTQKLFFTFRSELFYNFLGAIRLHRLPIIPVRYEHINDALLFAVQSLDALRAKADLPQAIDQLVELSTAKSIPLTIFYGTKERFFSSQAIDRFFASFGLTVPEEVLLVDPASDLPKKAILDSYGSRQPRVKGILLKGGGHFAFASYPAFTGCIVEDLLRRSEGSQI